MEQNKNQLQIFNNEEFGQVRTILSEEGEPWFVGKDIAEKLGYKDTSDAIKRHVDEEDKLTRNFTDSGQSREMIIINESGMYSLVLKSRLPQAKSFKRWVTNEVLPTLRKTGTYSLQEKENNELTVIANNLLEQVTSAMANMENRIDNKLNEMQEKQEELDDYYKPTHKKKLGMNGLIKTCLGDNATKDNCDKATMLLLTLLGNYETYQEVNKDVLEDVNTKALAYDICKNINISINKGIAIN